MKLKGYWERESVMISVTSIVQDCLIALIDVWSQGSSEKPLRLSCVCVYCVFEVLIVCMCV